MMSLGATVTAKRMSAQYYAQKLYLVHACEQDTMSYAPQYTFNTCTNLEYVNYKNLMLGSFVFQSSGLKAFVYTKDYASGSEFTSSKHLKLFSSSASQTTPSTLYQCQELEWLSIGNIRVFSMAGAFESLNIDTLIIPAPQSGMNISISSGCFNTNASKIIFNGNVSMTAGSGNRLFGNSYLQDIEYKGTCTITGTNYNSMYSYCYALPTGKMQLTSSNITSISTCTGVMSYTLSICDYTMPLNFKVIPNTMFVGSTLQKLTVHSEITKIGTQAIANCYLMKEIKFEGSTPPTASNANWYSNVPTTCKILVLAGSLSAYTSATNYPPSATYTYEEWS